MPWHIGSLPYDAPRNQEYGPTSGPVTVSHGPAKEMSFRRVAVFSARLEDGTLRIVEGKCPNLLAEAELYRYSTEAEDKRAETPVDDNNHALAALRYLISQLDAGKLGRRDRKEAGSPDQALKVEAAQKKWMSWRNEALWRPVW
jgi:hypothetical protein